MASIVFFYKIQIQLFSKSVFWHRILITMSTIISKPKVAISFIVLLVFAVYQILLRNGYSIFCIADIWRVILATSA